jgi:RNA polymerase primary sigma factor
VINNIISSNDYRFIDNVDLLSINDEKLLFELLNSGDEKITKKVRNIIVICNLRFVRSLAYSYSLKNTKFPFDELMEEGIIGLIKAIDSFDFTKGNKFSTYAHNAIKQKIVSYCNRGTSQISFSYDFSEKKIIYMKIKKDYIRTYGKNPSDEYMKEQFRLNWRYRISDRALNELFDLIEKCSLDIYSLSMPIGTTDDYYLEDVVPDGDKPFVEKIEDNELRFLFKKVFDEINLNERERKIMNYRYGLNGYPVLTFEEIHSIFSVSYQRVQQIDKRVLEKIRNNEDCRYILSGYHK